MIFWNTGEMCRQTCLITGINGFAGSYLAQLLSKDYEVYGIFKDNVFSSLEKIKEKIFLYRADILDKDQVLEVASRIRPGLVFHLAAQSSISLAEKQPGITEQVNVRGTRNVLEAIKRVRPDARILFTSSSAVYGDVPLARQPIREEEQPRPASVYARTKLMAEELCRKYVEEDGMHIIITRSFNHTGPGQAPTFVCSDWARQIALIEKGMQEPLIQVGNTAVKRDFSDVRDVVRAYSLLIQKTRPGEIYNVSSGYCNLLENILKKLVTFSQNNITVRVAKAKFRHSSIPIQCGDSSKLRKETGWIPRIDFDTTLMDILTYWRKNAAGGIRTHDL